MTHGNNGFPKSVLTISEIYTARTALTSDWKNSGNPISQSGVSITGKDYEGIPKGEYADAISRDRTRCAEFSPGWVQCIPKTHCSSSPADPRPDSPGKHGDGSHSSIITSHGNDTNSGRPSVAFPDLRLGANLFQCPGAKEPRWRSALDPNRHCSGIVSQTIGICELRGWIGHQSSHTLVHEKRRTILDAAEPPGARTCLFCQCPGWIRYHSESASSGGNDRWGAHLECSTLVSGR